MSKIYRTPVYCPLDGVFSSPLLRPPPISFCLLKIAWWRDAALFFFRADQPFRDRALFRSSLRASAISFFGTARQVQCPLRQVCRHSVFPPRLLFSRCNIYAPESLPKISEARYWTRQPLQNCTPFPLSSLGRATSLRSRASETPSISLVPSSPPSSVPSCDPSLLSLPEWHTRRIPPAPPPDQSPAPCQPVSTRPQQQSFSPPCTSLPICPVHSPYFPLHFFFHPPPCTPMAMRRHSATSLPPILRAFRDFLQYQRSPPWICCPQSFTLPRPQLSVFFSFPTLCKS